MDMLIESAISPPSELWGVSEWAAARTHSRCEKILLKRFQGRGVRAYLPAASQQRLYEGRRRTVEIPLFPGYLFYDRSAIRRLEVLSIREVAQVLEPANPVELREELLRLEDGLSRAGRSWSELSFTIRGAPVEVVSGPLKGLRGEFIEHKTGGSLLIRVTLLGRLVETSLDAVFVRPL
ncbi:MAG: Transcription antitermination protein RfaH [Myxococcota bacterium]|nr:Transcription antitermination protein RfaH [Myxococcota bacterium]